MNTTKDGCPTTCARQAARRSAVAYACLAGARLTADVSVYRIFSAKFNYEYPYEYLFSACKACNKLYKYTVNTTKPTDIITLEKDHNISA